MEAVYSLQCDQIYSWMYSYLDRFSWTFLGCKTSTRNSFNTTYPTMRHRRPPLVESLLARLRSIVVICVMIVGAFFSLESWVAIESCFNEPSIDANLTKASKKLVRHLYGYDWLARLAFWEWKQGKLIQNASFNARGRLPLTISPLDIDRVNPFYPPKWSFVSKYPSGVLFLTISYFNKISQGDLSVLAWSERANTK